MFLKKLARFFSRINEFLVRILTQHSNFTKQSECSQSCIFELPSDMFRENAVIEINQPTGIDQSASVKNAANKVFLINCDCRRSESLFLVGLHIGIPHLTFKTSDRLGVYEAEERNAKENAGDNAACIPRNRE